MNMPKTQAYMYLASPYTDPDIAVMEQRYLAAMKATHWCLTHSIQVFSPIVHCHEMAIKYIMPRDFDFWREYDQAMIAPCSGLLILDIEGWTSSKGVTSEINLAIRLGKSISHLIPEKGGTYVINF